MRDIYTVSGTHHSMDFYAVLNRKGTWTAVISGNGMQWREGAFSTYSEALAHAGIIADQRANRLDG